MDSLIETLNGQIKTARPDLEVNYEFIQGREPGEFPIWMIYAHDFKSRTYVAFLIITEANIVQRRGANKRNATWTIRQDDWESLLKEADAVVVCYGESSKGGEFWEESSGNDRKGSYRRLSRTDKVTGKDCEFNEIYTCFSEENIKCIWTENPLTDLCDYVR